MVEILGAFEISKHYYDIVNANIYNSIDSIVKKGKKRSEFVVQYHNGLLKMYIFIFI